MTEIKRTRTRPDDPGLVGQVLGGFEVTSPLSTGGMGAVFRAVRLADKRPAAIKVLRPELTSNHELVQRFFTEAKAASAIRHPNIVETFEFGYTDEGLAYIAMELLEGQSLAHRLVEQTRLSELVAASIARGIASALTAAHAKGIIHRDLKPDNVMLVPDKDALFGERAVLLDFGIAKLTDPSEDNIRHTRTGALIGTPMYMAPEQARAAGDIDHRADLYSLGCILYELLVGAPPFVAEGAGEIIALQMFAAPEPLRARLPSLSPELEAITLRLLDKEPSARYQTAEDTVEALSGVLGRLSGRLATVVPGSGASLASLFPPPASAAQSGPAMSALLSTKLPMLDEAPPPPEKRSALMPVIAAVLTIGIAGAGIMLVWKHGATAPAVAATSDAAVAPPIAVMTDASAAPVAPIAVIVDASVEPAPPSIVPPPPLVPAVVTAGSDDAHGKHPPKHVVTAGRHGDHASPGPTTAIDGSGPVTMPTADDSTHSTGNSPIFQDLGSDAAKPAPAPDKPAPAPAPAPPPPPPPAPEKPAEPATP